MLSPCFVPVPVFCDYTLGISLLSTDIFHDQQMEEFSQYILSFKCHSAKVALPFWFVYLCAVKPN